jgi:hypothetical protein
VAFETARPANRKRFQMRQVLRRAGGNNLYLQPCRERMALLKQQIELTHDFSGVSLNTCDPLGQEPAIYRPVQVAHDLTPVDLYAIQPCIILSNASVRFRKTVLSS